MYSYSFMQNSHIQSFYWFQSKIPPLTLFCLDLLIFLTNPIITHKTMIITINMNTVTVGIVITPTLETTARRIKKCEIVTHA